MDKWHEMSQMTGPLHVVVTWYNMHDTGGVKNKGKSSWIGASCFVFELP